MKRITVTLLLALAMVALASCVKIADVESIELNWTPKVEYVKDELVELDNKVVTVNYEAERHRISRFRMNQSKK